MSVALDALRETRFFDVTETTVLPVPVKRPHNPQALKTKRLTIDIPGDLHIRIKVACAHQGLTLGELIGDMLATRFPA
jgi:hypothetical protein